jgi:transcriptional regulator with XRE-family HTH domain
MTAIPPVRRRLVGRALRRYRENLGYALEDAAQVLECDRSKISRIETGQRGIRAKELQELLTEYGVDEQGQAALAAIADPRAARGWWRAYADVVPGLFQDYLTLEMAASQILVYEAQQVPGLMQTPDYARAVAAADPALIDGAAVDRAVEARLARQRAVLGERKPDVTMVIGEAALRQAIGTAAVMRAQLASLARIARDSGRLTVQVLPSGSGAHAAAGIGSMSILQFADAPGLGVVHLTGVAGGVCLDGTAELAAYGHAFEQLRAFALQPAASARLLQELAAD